MQAPSGVAVWGEVNCRRCLVPIRCCGYFGNCPSCLEATTTKWAWGKQDVCVLRIHSAKVSGEVVTPGTHLQVTLEVASDMWLSSIWFNSFLGPKAEVSAAYSSEGRRAPGGAVPALMGHAQPRQLAKKAHRTSSPDFKCVFKHPDCYRGWFEELVVLLTSGKMTS